MQGFLSCGLHGVLSKVQATLRTPEPLVPAQVLITEGWRVQAHPCPHSGAVEMTGLTFHQAISGKTAECLASPGLGAAGHPAVPHNWWWSFSRRSLQTEVLPHNSQAHPHPIYEYRTETFQVSPEVNFSELLSQQECQLAKRKTGSGSISRLLKILGEQ